MATDRSDAASTSLPWNEKTAANRVRPRECVGLARDALNRAYGHKERAQVPLIIEAVDWLRRALEQMAATRMEGCSMSAPEETTRNAASTYHDSHPVHTAINEYEGGPLAFKREGDTIIVYPGAFRLTLSEWASAVAFTTAEGETGPMYHAILALIGETDA